MQSAPFRDRHPKFFVAALMALVCLAQTFFYALPAYVSLMGKGWGFSKSQIGLVVMAEILGSSSGSLLVSFALVRVPVRRVLFFALLALILGNAGLMTQRSYEVGMLARAVSGLGTGIVGGVTLKYLAGSGTWLSVLAVVQGIYTLALLTGIMPMLPTPTAAFGYIVALAVLAMPMVLLFASDEALVGGFGQAQTTVVRGGAYLALFSLLGIAAACGIVWTFIGHLGAAAGLDERQLSSILGAVTIAALGICFALPWLMTRGHRYTTAVILLLVYAMSVAVMATPLSPWSFTLNTLVFVSGWNGALILIYSTVAAYDPVGRHVASCNGFLGIGFAIGSTVGGRLIEGTGGPSAFVLAAVFGFVAAGLYAALRAVPHAKAREVAAPGAAAG